MKHPQAAMIENAYDCQCLMTSVHLSLLMATLMEGWDPFSSSTLLLKHRRMDEKDLTEQTVDAACFVWPLSAGKQCA